MEPTLLNDEKVIISRFYYYFTSPAYNDIVAFPYRSDPSKFYIKRIIGLPGDVVDFVDYQFTLNGKVLDDDFSEESIVALGDVEFPLTVPEDSYFVLGDNRNRSNDSRFKSVGCIKRSEILGKVQLRIWPLNKIGLI